MKKILLNYLFITVFFAHISSLCLSPKDFQSPKNWSNPEICNFLKNSKVLHIEPIQNFLKGNNKKFYFTSKIFLITLTNNIKAVFKPSESFTKSFPSKSETAAYQASLFLEFPHIPPTVTRTINNESGSLQLFVDTKIDLLKKNEYEHVLNNIEKETLENIKIFQFIFGQWDSTLENLIALNHNNKLFLIAIDNSEIYRNQYVQYGNIPFSQIILGQPLKNKNYKKKFPFNKAKIIKKPFLKNLKIAFKDNNLEKKIYKKFSYIEKYIKDEQIKLIFYNGTLWRQFHAFNEKFIKAFSKTCSEKTLHKIKELNIEALEKIFSEAKDSNFLTQSYLENILERRDQVVHYFEKNNVK